MSLAKAPETPHPIKLPLQFHSCIHSPRRVKLLIRGQGESCDQVSRTIRNHFSRQPILSHHPCLGLDGLGRWPCDRRLADMATLCFGLLGPFRRKVCRKAMWRSQEQPGTSYQLIDLGLILSVPSCYKTRQPKLVGFTLQESVGAHSYTPEMVSGYPLVILSNINCCQVQ